MYDVFLSYAHADREPVLALRDELVERGLCVWLDDADIDDFESISASIEEGLARSKALVAYYSTTYPTRRACQWELTAAFLAAQRHGNPQRRVLVVNPESSVEHIEPAALRDELFGGGADAIAAHVGTLSNDQGDLGVFVRPPWFGQQPLGSSRFVGRVVDMWHIHDALHAGDVALITGARGDALAHVTGMGGIGKSLLAEEYALRFGAAYPGGVFWLRALGHDDAGEPLSPENRAAERDRQLLEFASGLGMDVTDLPPERLAGELTRALDERGQPFLWIVDDFPGGVSREDREAWLAPGRYGKTLLTTRSRAYAAFGTQVDLGVLGEDEGVEPLARHRTPGGDEEQAAARGLVEDLGGHALALDVAGAALRAAEGVRSFAQYRAALANPSADELELSTRYAGELPSGHEASIASTLSRSIAQLDGAGRDFLRLAALLAVQPIPATLVVDVFARADDLEADAAQRRAIDAMHGAGLLSLADAVDGGARQVHTLVSRTMRLIDGDGERSRALSTAAVAALTAELRAATSTHISAAGPTLAHARRLASPPSNNEQVTLLMSVAMHDWYRGDHRAARPLEEQALEARVRVLGKEHPDTLMSMNNLAETLRGLGDFGRARGLQERVLETQVRVLGEEHPATLISMNNLAGTLRGLGELVDARALHERVLEVRERVLGEEHPDTLTSMNNLALTLFGLGDLERAKGLHERALEVQVRGLGEEHPDTLISMNNLAKTLQASGDLSGAIALLEPAWEALRRTLGDEHPSTVTVKANLDAVRRGLRDS